MKVNSWVKRIRRSSSFQAEGWRRTSAASVSSLVAQWHGERGFLHHHSPGFLVLWTHEAASGRNGSSGTQKVQCTVTAVFCFETEGGKGGRRRLSPQSHLFDLPLCEHCCAPDMTRSIPSATGTTWNEFPGAVCHTVLTQPQGWQPAEVSSEELIKSWPPCWLLLLVWWWRDVPRNKLLWEAA